MHVTVLVHISRDIFQLVGLARHLSFLIEHEHIQIVIVPFIHKVLKFDGFIVIYPPYRDFVCHGVTGHWSIDEEVVVNGL